jgi:hypothetical protein
LLALSKILFIKKLEQPDLRRQQITEKIAVENQSEVAVEVVDAALRKWCQGDCVLGEQWFVYRFNPKRPLTRSFSDVGQEDIDLAESKVRGFAVITQTCDVVRSCINRPFIEIAPLVQVDERRLYEIQRGKRPQYAYISGVADYRLVADLDRVMTVEKAVVSEWQRVPGCRNDQDVRAVRQALARKRIRFAFPDDFTGLANKLQKRMQEKHAKESQEGDALRALREIRVRAEPSWDAPEVKLMFWFIRYEQEDAFMGTSWDQFLSQWLKLLSVSERFYWGVMPRSRMLCCR